MKWPVKEFLKDTSHTFLHTYCILSGQILTVFETGRERLRVKAYASLSSRQLQRRVSGVALHVLCGCHV